MNDQLKELINSVGMLAEICKIHHVAFLKAGFSNSEAFELTKTALSTMLESMLGMKGGKE